MRRGRFIRPALLAAALFLIIWLAAGIGRQATRSLDPGATLNHLPPDPDVARTYVTVRPEPAPAPGRPPDTVSGSREPAPTRPELPPQTVERAPPARTTESSPPTRSRRNSAPVSAEAANPGDDRARGKALLGVDGGRQEGVPAVSMDYRREMGWPGYVKMVQRLGGAFFIHDRPRDRLAARVDMSRADIEPLTAEMLYGLSPRLREIREEVAIDPLLKRTAERLGPGQYGVVVLLPLAVDFEVMGGMARELAARNIPMEEVGRVSGFYVIRGSRLALQVERVQLRDWQEEAVSFAVELTLQG